MLFNDHSVLVYGSLPVLLDISFAVLGVKNITDIAFVNSTIKD